MVRLWEGAQAEPLGSPIDCTDEVRSLAFSPDGTTLAIVGRNDKVRFWDIRRAQFSPTVVAHGPRVFAIAYSRSGKVLATGGGDRQVRFWIPTTAGRSRSCFHTRRRSRWSHSPRTIRRS